MDGRFHIGKAFKIYNGICIVCGVIITALFAFLLFGTEAGFAWDDIAISVFFVFFGILLTAFGAGSLYVAGKAFIHVDDETVSAFCPLGFSLNCRIEDIDILDCEEAGLRIRLKNGKRYCIFFLENENQLYRYIRKRMPSGDGLSVSTDEMAQAVDELTFKKRRVGRAVIAFAVPLLPLLLLSGYLVGSDKDMHDFTGNDWMAFLIPNGIAIVSAVVAIFLIVKLLRLADDLFHAQNALYGRLMRTEPLPSGNPLRSFIKENGPRSYRLTVYGLPDTEQVYCVLETVVGRELQVTLESGLFESINEIQSDLDTLEEIPLPAQE